MSAQICLKYVLRRAQQFDSCSEGSLVAAVLESSRIILLMLSAKQESCQCHFCLYQRMMLCIIPTHETICLTYTMMKNICTSFCMQIMRTTQIRFANTIFAIVNIAPLSEKLLVHFEDLFYITTDLLNISQLQQQDIKIQQAHYPFGHLLIQKFVTRFLYGQKFNQFS